MTCFCDLLSIAFGEFSRGNPERVFKPDPDMATHRESHRGDAHLAGAGAQD